MIKVKTDNARLLWQAVHNERQRIKQEIRNLEERYNQEGITEEEAEELEQLKEDHSDLLEMERCAEGGNATPVASRLGCQPARSGKRVKGRQKKLFRRFSGKVFSGWRSVPLTLLESRAIWNKHKEARLRVPNNP